MSLRHEPLSPVTSWVNGRKAVVHLLADAKGHKIIKKVYRPGFRRRLFREFVMTAYVAQRLSIVPRVLAFHPWTNELLLEYLPGQRVLEWVLLRYAEPGLDPRDFQSIHGLNPPHNVDPRIAAAFARFRESSSAEAQRLRVAVRESYRSLHRIGVKHGSADPRNVLYDAGRIYIIDFDNARPSLGGRRADNDDLNYWFGPAL